MQEAVADRMQSAVPPCSTHSRPRAQVLRAIRIGSLVHGTPERIPIWCGEPLFLKPTTSHQQGHGSIEYVMDINNIECPVSYVTHALRYESARSLRMPGRTDYLSILEGPQQERWLAKYAGWLKRGGPEKDTLQGIERLVREALRNGDPVILRQWWKQRPKRQRLA
jgi:hypothetical protein